MRTMTAVLTSVGMDKCLRLCLHFGYLRKAGGILLVDTWSAFFQTAQREGQCEAHGLS